MLRADNTTVIVLALQERGGPPIPMHRDEIVVDMATGIDHVPYPGTPYNTCEVQKVSAGANHKVQRYSGTLCLFVCCPLFTVC